MILQDLLHVDGSDNTAGIQQYLYMIRIADILTFPKPVLDDSAGEGTFADLVTITGNIVLKPTGQMKRVYVTLETGELKDDSQGEFDGMSFKNTLEFLIPGTKAEVLGFKQHVKNGNFVFLVPENDGAVRLLGHPGYPAKLVSAPGTTGKGTADRKSSTFTFQSVRKGPAPIFQGKVMGGADGSTEQEIVFID